MKKRPVEERFWEKVKVIHDEDSCWEWQAGVNSRGRPQISINNKPCSASRFSYTLNIGPIPGGLDVLHTCDNKLCMRPKHLYAGTDLDNSRDRIARGKEFHPKGIDNGMCKINPEIVQEIRSSPLSSRKAAKQFGISATQIRRIRLNKSWRK